MKLFENSQSRDEYIQEQIDRSNEKFNFCKVSFRHVAEFYRILKKYDYTKGPRLCLGTRNGREIDLFRIAFSNKYILKFLVRFFEINRSGWKSIFPFFETIGRNSFENFKDDAFYGVEINPEGKRADVHVGSFDDLPENWNNTFGLIYSNSFDQSQDPNKTSKEWLRVIKNSGVIILGFTFEKPTLSDPVGNLTIEDIIKLFPGELLYYRKNGSNYNDAIIKISK